MTEALLITLYVLIGFIVGLVVLLRDPKGYESPVWTLIACIALWPLAAGILTLEWVWGALERLLGLLGIEPAPVSYYF